MRHQTLYKVIAVLLLLIAAALVAEHWMPGHGEPLLSGIAQWIAGLVAGGELLIPTFVLLFGAEIKLAGSLSLAVRLPTMIAGFMRYSRDSSFQVLGQNLQFVLIMAADSLVGAALGGALHGVVPSAVLLPLLSMILAISAFKVWQHK